MHNASAAAPDAVVAGHIALDLFPELPGPVAYEPGRLTVVGPALISTGGSVSNTGLTLHRLGVPVRLVAKVGDDLFGRAVLDALAQIGGDLGSEIVVSARDVTS
jgi:sugar/nucleoside kinase (ribokinase family)